MTPDSIPTHWSHRLPASLRPYAQLARWDRPVGYWLLTLPGWVGIAFAGLTTQLDWSHAAPAALILIGAIAMRGAGCTYNDIVDRELDAQVERTRARPLPSGAVTTRQAWVWLVVQCLVGLVVLLLLPNRLSQLVALGSLPLVAAYPFMKRITGFPQVWLGLTFNWAVLVAYAAVSSSIDAVAIFAYLGLALWTLGYDTIYALQDIEDDAMAGIKSSALSFGRFVRPATAVIYALSVWMIYLAAYITVMDTYRELYPWQFAVLPFALHLLWQVIRLRTDDPALALRLFKSNGVAGIILVLSFLACALAFGNVSQVAESFDFQGNVISK